MSEQDLKQGVLLFSTTFDLILYFYSGHLDATKKSEH